MRPFPPELGTFCPRGDATELCHGHLRQLTRLRQLPSRPGLSAFCLLTGGPSSTERSKGSLLYGCRRTSGGTLDLGDGNFSLPAELKWGEDGQNSFQRKGPWQELESLKGPWPLAAPWEDLAALLVSCGGARLPLQRRSLTESQMSQPPAQLPG